MIRVLPSFMKQIIIRTIEKKDILGFHQALESVASEGIYLRALPPIAFEKVEDFILNNIAKNYPQYVAVAQDEGVSDEVVGWADVRPYDEPTMQHVGLLGMGVLSTYRSQGIGKKLLEKIIKRTWQIGYQRLELEVYAENQRAINLYQKMGFVLEGTRQYARYYNGQYQHCHIMAQHCFTAETLTRC